MAHQHGRRRHERGGQRLDAAPAARLETFRRQQQSVDAIVVPTDIELEHRPAVSVGLGLRQFERDRAARPVWIVRIAERIHEHISGMLAELRRNGSYLQRPAHLPCRCGRAEQVLQRHLGEMGAGLKPAAFRALARRLPRTPLNDCGADAQTIRLVVLDAERRIAQPVPPTVVID